MKQSTTNPTTNSHGAEVIPAGTFFGGEEIPAGTFHGGEEIPAGTFHDDGVTQCYKCGHWIATSRLHFHWRTCKG